MIVLASLAFSLALPHQHSIAAVDMAAEEQQLLALINQARSDAGLAPLYAEQQLTTMARDYSAEMIQYDFFGHVSPVSGDLQARVAAHGITGWLLAGENIAKSPNIDSAFTAFMNSPTHRDNILKPDYNCTGIGIQKGPNGLVISQEFMNFAEVPTTADIPGQQPAAPATPAALFDSYFLVMNPNDGQANIDVTFQDDAGNQRVFHYTVSSHSRYTIPARETLGGTGSFATTIKSDVPVLAERAMYFDSNGRTGGHDSIGAPQASGTWYFAEGYTGGSFDTWIMVMNPNGSAVTATLNFMLDDGRVVPYPITIPAGGRQGVHVDTIAGLENCNVSTQVTCDKPIVAERSMYFDYQGKAGGHNSIGATQPSPNWYFAEGYTGGDFDTWILLQNPNASAVSATLNFMLDDGRVVPYKVSIPAKARYTVPVDAVPGLENCSVSTQVTCDKPIVAERSMYFDYEGKDDGHNSIGVTQPSGNWYFAEGYTGGDFDTWVLVQNPNPNPTKVTLKFMLDNGSVVPYPITIPAKSRYSVHVDKVPGLESVNVSTEVTSDLPVVAERAMYFSYNGKDGGHDSIGSVVPSNTWYFAEGSVQ
jgi:hypothetical protein